MAWIRTVPEDEATGALKRQYGNAVKRAGRVYNIVKIMSLNAETLRTSMCLYISTMKGPSPLSRAQREMLATVVSWANNCHY